MEHILELRQLSFCYPAQERPALNNVSLSVARGGFLVLCGASGCGKTTLLRQLKPTLAPHGTQTGQILIGGRPLETLDGREQTARIGFVLQNPDNQLVTDKVWHELAFGLESLGLDTPAIRRRVAEMAAFFGIDDWFDRQVATLSGGEKQLLNLAAVMVLQPDILVLDEPTSQLDPIAASDFLSMLGRLNRELGTTVLLSEQRLEEALPLATQVASMDGGRLLYVGDASQTGHWLREAGHSMFAAMPTAMRIWAAVENDFPCPVTVRDGRKWLEQMAAARPLGPVPDAPTIPVAPETAIAVKEAWFRYEKNQPDIVRGLTFDVQKGDFFALLGGNGAGKTTTLRLIAELQKPYRGAVQVSGSVGVLPQAPQTLFTKKTVAEDLAQHGDKATQAELIALCQLEPLLERHPFDLSGGEQQRLALAKVLSLRPDVLLLDEPTKGLDAGFKAALAELLSALTARGVTIFMVSHDVEFCASHARTCALFFDGTIVSQGTPRQFFSQNNFYTTAASRMARGLLPGAVTAEDIICACGGSAQPPAAPAEPSAPMEPPSFAQPPIAHEASPPPDKKSRRPLAIGLLLLLIPLTLYVGNYVLSGQKYYFIALLIMLECMLCFFLSFEQRRPQARELVTLAALCGIGVASRAVFFMLPQFTPVMAVVILAGASFGGEAGFLVGAATMLVSNVLLSQGPWTPWQMFAMGLVGLLAGLLVRRNGQPGRRGLLCLYGVFAAIVIYGGIMNPASVLMWTTELDWEMIAAAYGLGFPMDCVQALATAAFLWFAGEAILEKLERIKVKYGLIA